MISRHLSGLVFPRLAAARLGMDAISYSRARAQPKKARNLWRRTRSWSQLRRCFLRTGVLGVSQYNIGNSEPFFVPGGSAMYILVPWKPVVLVWGLLSGMILVSFVASSLLQGKNPFAPGANITQPIVKTGVVQAGQPKHSQKAAQAPTR